MKIKYTVLITAATMIFATGVAVAASPKSSPRQAAGGTNPCQSSQVMFQKRTQLSTEKIEKMISDSDENSKKSENSYNDGSVHKAKSIDNYDSRVADIAAKKNALNASLEKINADSISICNGDVKAQMHQFLEDSKLIAPLLNEYRRAVNSFAIIIKLDVTAVAPPTTPTPVATLSPATTPSPLSSS